MRSLLIVAAVLSLAGAAYAQPLPPQQKNNDASVDGAVTTKLPSASPIPERRDDTVNTLGRTGPSGNPGTTTGSALPGRNAVDDEVDAATGTTGTMDDDKSQAERDRAPRQRR